MRRLLVKIIQLLDGTPAVYGKRQAGQSVVELALITPILIILLAGLVEIGWFANNYLNLLDVSRAGARRGAVLQDVKSPTSWDNLYSYVPNALLAASVPIHPEYYQMPNTLAADALVNGTDAQRFTYRWYPDQTLGAAADGPCTGSDPRNGQLIDPKFYNIVICTMVTSMEPLVLNPTNGIDDIIVTGYSLQLIDATAHPTWLPSNLYDTTHPQMVVVGRYPTNANECDVAQDGFGNPSAILDQREGRDPFDFNNNGRRDIAPPGGTDAFTELTGYDAPNPDPAYAEKQVGFSLFGNHKIPGTFCVGSEWTIRKVETMMNFTDPNNAAVNDYDLNTNTQKDYLASQGLLLVEIYWEHEMLLKIPILSPVFTVVGNQNGKMVINVWAAFPLSSVEPHIIFPP